MYILSHTLRVIAETATFALDLNPCIVEFPRPVGVESEISEDGRGVMRKRINSVVVIGFIASVLLACWGKDCV